MSTVLPMPTESNLSQPPRIAAADLITILVTIVGVGIAVIAILLTEIHDIRQQAAADQSATQQLFTATQQMIQSSESGRQADARAINARVDAAEQLILASTPYRCPPIN